MQGLKPLASLTHFVLRGRVAPRRYAPASLRSALKQDGTSSAFKYDDQALATIIKRQGSRTPLAPQGSRAAAVPVRDAGETERENPR